MTPRSRRSFSDRLTGTIIAVVIVGALVATASPAILMLSVAWCLIRGGCL